MEVGGEAHPEQRHRAGAQDDEGREDEDVEEPGPDLAAGGEPRLAEAEAHERPEALPGPVEPVLLAEGPERGQPADHREGEESAGRNEEEGGEPGVHGAR